MMKIFKYVLVVLLVFTLASCGSDASLYNFSPRQDNTMFSSDNKIVIDYKTNKDGKLIELNIDRLLTIEEMIILNPIIDFDYEIEGFTGDIFMEPNNTCTDISNSFLVPINIEVGNTRYKYDDDECMYKTVDNNNEFKAGYADEYLLTDTIPEPKHVKISIIVYNPDELVSFIEIYEIPNTYEKLGVYNILINRDRNGFENGLVNYYRDMSIFEQLYLKHQEAEGAINEVMGISTEINLMDFDSMLDVVPLIEDFEDFYELEIEAIDEFQQEIGTAFENDDEPIDDDEPIEEE